MAVHIFDRLEIEKWLKRVVPAVIAHNVNSFLTILITFPLAVLVIGPVTNVLSSLIGAGVSGLYGISPMVTSLVVALLYQPLVIFGLHWPISAIGINNLAQHGMDYIFPMSFTANFAQTAVVLAVFLKTRSKDQKTLAIPTMVSGLFCIIEPDNGFLAGCGLVGAVSCDGSHAAKHCRRWIPRRQSRRAPSPAPTGS